MSTTPTSAEAVLEALDPEQREVATALHGPVAVLAGAGTGKTRAITHRIAHGVAVGAYVPQSVLAVTFTTRAAGEMRHRLQQLGVHGVQARTFHSAALRQAQFFWPRVHGTDLPPVLDRPMGVVAEAATRLRLRPDTAMLRDLVAEISWAKVSNVEPDDYPGLAQRAGRSVGSLDPGVVGRVYEGYEQLKRDRARIDFNDILLCTASLLAQPEVAAQVRAAYRHFVVDEYQDVSPLQQALLRQWVGGRGELCVVGDPAQTIHTFAGARADYLRDFAREHPGASVVRLVRNYRSTPEILTVANGVLAAAPRAEGQGSVLELRAQRPSGAEPLVVAAADDRDEADGVARWVEECRTDGIALREIAVLYRVNSQAPALEQALAQRGLTYLVRSGEKFYDRPEVRQTLHALTRAVETGTAASGRVEVLAAVDGLLTAAGWTPEPPAGTGAVRERWESVAALRAAVVDVLDGADVEPGAPPPTTLAEVADALRRRAELQHVPAADGVTLSTVHAAKGLEWDAVAVIGCAEGKLPFVLADGPIEVGEERRLFYVALTRARHRLRLSWARGRARSRFLAALGGAEPTPAGAGRRSAPRRDRTRLSRTCRYCRESLTEPGEMKVGWHADCGADVDTDLLEHVRDWRRERAAEAKLPAYCVFTDATMLALVAARPTSRADLAGVPGIGPGKIDKYGEGLLEVFAHWPQGSADSASPTPAP